MQGNKNRLYLQKIYGDEGRVQTLNFLNTQTNEEFNLDVKAVFIAIGQSPKTDIFDTLVDRFKGYILTDEDMQTKTDGLYAIGDVRSITANIGYNLGGRERILDPALAGGALLDIGVYPLTAVFMIMGGPPSQVIATPITTNTGVDAFSTILMGYPQGRNAYVTTTVTTKLDNKCIIYGTHGRIEINNVNNPSQVTVYGSDGQSKGELVPQDDAKTGYEYEFKAARKAAIAGNMETPELSRKDTIELYKFIDTIRYTWNLPFPLPGEPEKRVQNPEKAPAAENTDNTENA